MRDQATWRIFREFSSFLIWSILLRQRVWLSRHSGAFFCFFFGHGTRYGRDGTCMGVILRVSDVQILFLLRPFLLDTFGMLINVVW